MKYFAIFDENGYRITSYVEGVHKNIPPDAIEISEQDQKLYQTGRYKRGSDGKAELIPPVEKKLDQLKAEKILLAGQEFAKRRDAVRWVNGYGFDCAPEDITNFMSAYTPMLIQSVVAPDTEASTIYKVWLDEATKGLRQFTVAQLTEVYSFVRISQFEAYAWYETIKAQIEAAETKEELAAVVWEYDETVDYISGEGGESGGEEA